MWTAQETTTGERSQFTVPAGSDFFKVIDTVSGQEQKTTYATLEQAQKRADALNSSSDEDDVYDIFFDDNTHIDYYATTTPMDVDYVDSSDERADYADS